MQDNGVADRNCRSAAGSFPNMKCGDWSCQADLPPSSAQSERSLAEPRQADDVPALAEYARRAVHPALPSVLLRSEPDCSPVKGRGPRRGAAGSTLASQGVAAFTADRKRPALSATPPFSPRIVLTLGQAASPVRVDRTRETVPENGRPRALLNQHGQGHSS